MSSTAVTFIVREGIALVFQTRHAAAGVWVVAAVAGVGAGVVDAAAGLDLFLDEGGVESGRDVGADRRGGGSCAGRGGEEGNQDEEEEAEKAEERCGSCGDGHGEWRC